MQQFLHTFIVSLAFGRGSCSWRTIVILNQFFFFFFVFCFKASKIDLLPNKRFLALYFNMALIVKRPYLSSFNPFGTSPLTLILQNSPSHIYSGHCYYFALKSSNLGDRLFVLEIVCDGDRAWSGIVLILMMCFLGFIGVWFAKALYGLDQGLNGREENYELLMKMIDW